MKEGRKGWAHSDMLTALTLSYDTHSYLNYPRIVPPKLWYNILYNILYGYFCPYGTTVLRSTILEKVLTYAVRGLVFLIVQVMLFPPPPSSPQELHE